MVTGSNGGEVVIETGSTLIPSDRGAALQDAMRKERDFLHAAFRELYQASIPLTGDGPPTQEQWNRWFAAMHEAHEWTMDESDPLWPEWAGPEPL